MLGPHGPNAGVYQGNARELAEAIPDESVDLIFTDPVYQNIDDYKWLAETAARVLKPDRACLAWYGGPKLHEVGRMMSEIMVYTWTLNYVVIAKPNKLIGYNIFTWTTQCLWFRKGKGFPKDRIPDTYVSTASPSGSFKWNKNVGVITKWVGAFTKPGNIVFDPFTGGGTVPAVCKILGRKWLAFEIEPDTATRARERVCLTQPPLPLVIPCQDAMSL